MSRPSDDTPTETSRAKFSGVSRRGFLKGAAVSAAGAAIGDQIVQAADAPPATPQPPSGQVAVALSVNGKDVQVTCEPRTTLLNAMRDYMEPACTSAKLVCGMGTCGACTAIVDGKAVYSCLVLAADAAGKKVVTAEGLGSPEKMNAVQQAFCEKDALMCGFCTPGYVTAISAWLHTNPGKEPTHDQIKEACKGNFCRCGTYPRVFEAALAAAQAGAKA
jgi:xanthine dehydrogenase YagT iron-sulfur-binding subunit